MNEALQNFGREVEKLGKVATKLANKNAYADRAEFEMLGVARNLVKLGAKASGAFETAKKLETKRKADEKAAKAKKAAKPTPKAPPVTKKKAGVKKAAVKRARKPAPVVHDDEV